MAQARKPARARPATTVVSAEVFRAVYDSPASLPGKEKWITSDADVWEIEKLLGMNPHTVNAPLWVSGDTRRCPNCGRETTWLDIVDSALSQVHRKEMLVRVMLSEMKYVNIKAQRAIADLSCYCGKASILNLHDFKCPNRAYAGSALLSMFNEVQNE